MADEMFYQMRHKALLDENLFADNSPVSRAPFLQHEVTDWQFTSLVPMAPNVDFFLE